MRPRASGTRATEPAPRGVGSGRSLTVAHVVTTLAIGGLEKVVLDLVRCRTRPTFGAHVFCLDAAGVLQQEFHESGAPVEVIGTHGSVFRRILRLARRLRDVRPDVLHTHNPQAHLHGAWAAKLAGVPVVVHTRHGRDRHDRPALAALSRMATAWTTRFVAVSEDTARVAREIERVPAEKLLVIHNGIELERFPSSERGAAQPRARAVTVSRLDPIKDQATMLRATRLVADKIPGFRLDVVGDGPSRPNLQAIRTALGLEDQVSLHGYHADVVPFLAAADVFVLSSISEGISIALLEAMASGLPAVATDVGGNREVIVSGRTGFLTPVGSAEALAAAMIDLQLNPGVLNRMGRASRKRIEADFNLRHVVARYEAMYCRCLSGNRGRKGNEE